ncbi:hypothetical protein MesoLj113a_61180 [Mesorhizobium sp. 113-1-2]|nr:Uncharacterized protein MLTONO_6466 [Mesorhizobium loti]BCG74960.1 hypothetical protein MesoLj113a_61180 [Mesorhizobium sp. 113-1-2]
MIFTGSVNPASATAARSSWDPASRSGRASRARNVIYAFGHGHQGLIGGAVTGKIVSQLADGLPPVIDLTPFRADRF